MHRVTSASIAGFGAAIAILILSLITHAQHGLALLMAPFGATAVLIFGLPKSPLAQAKNVVFGHLLTAFIGLLVLHTLGVSPYTLAFATGLAVACMMISDTTHPPAGANPLLIMLTNQDWTFLVTPVLLGAMLLVFTGNIYTNIKDRL
jgi:CBS-domain-containing membrane protein